MKRRWLVEPCGADSAGDERGASSISLSAPEAPWEAVSDEGNVYINVVAGSTDACLAHRVTQIREALPCEVQDLYLVFHDGGAAALDAADAVAPSPLDGVVKGRKLWRVADGELCVDDTPTKIGVFVWDQRVRYERADVEIIIGKVKRPW